eukprot:Seg5320.2 transcript_id=Seg5320.2/GoldUCD/mRNA.D3Y31 product="hypothetical protein" protein_id=Seg5320.2/GoldUCD/D3Y31
MSAPEDQETVVDPQSAGRDVISRKEAMEQFDRIFSMLRGLTSQSNQTSLPQSSSSTSGAGVSTGSMGEHSVAAITTPQAGSSLPATAPPFLQVVQQPPPSAPAQNWSTPGEVPTLPTW